MLSVSLEIGRTQSLQFPFPLTRAGDLWCDSGLCAEAGSSTSLRGAGLIRAETCGTQRELSTESRILDGTFLVPPQRGPLFNLVTTVSLSDFVAFLGSHRKLTVEPGKKQTPTQKMEMRSLFWWLRLFSKDSGKKSS